MAMNKDFGAFELKEKIGSGGMASVYLAVQKSLQRPVVLKILYPHLAEDEKLVQRFEREAHAAAMMRHENIIQVIDCGRHDDVAYIAMEFVEGMDLKKWFEAHGTPPIEMALLMLRDLCRGLEHAHGHRIIHRDIKPANVMLTPDGTIKLMDFGLARSGSENSTQMTMVGSVMGTPAYMSPEQATGEVVDERSDIFSLGVLAYELLGGERPFNGDSYSTVLRSILTVDPIELSQFNPLVPEDVARIVRGMLQKDVSKRYASISLVREDLEGVIEQLGLLRGKDLLREYALDPATVGERWRQKRMSRHLDQGLFFENMGLGKIDDALLEFRRVLHLDPTNDTARDHVRKLERERESLIAGHQPPPPPPTAPPAPSAATPGDDKTMLFTPGAAAASMPPAMPSPGVGDDKTMLFTPGAAAASMPPSASPSGGGGDDKTMLFAPGAAGTSMPPAPPAPAPVAPPAPPRVEKPAARASESIPPTPRPAPTSKPAPAPRAAATPPTAKSGGLPMPLLVGIGAIVALIAVVSFLLMRKPAESSSSAPASPPVASAPAPVPSTPPSEPAKSAVAVTPGGHSAPVAPAAPAKKAGTGPVAMVSKSTPTPAPEKPRTRETKSAAPTPTPAPAPAPSGGGVATLTVKASPFASAILVDGEQKDANKGLYKLQLKPGRHTIRVTHPTAPAHEWKVELSAGEDQTLSHDFTSNFGTISITCEPTWGEIYLDGEAVGKTTPFELSNLRPKEYQVSLVRDGYKVEGGAQTVSVKPGQTVTVKFKLKKK